MYCLALIWTIVVSIKVVINKTLQFLYKHKNIHYKTFLCIMYSIAYFSKDIPALIRFKAMFEI